MIKSKEYLFIFVTFYNTNNLIFMYVNIILSMNLRLISLFSLFKSKRNKKKKKKTQKSDVYHLLQRPLV